MYRVFALAFLMALAGVSDASLQLAAQTSADMAPVPGPYRAMPAADNAANPNGNPDLARSMPYWMRPPPPRPGAAAPASGPVRQTFISGWVWTPYAPNRNAGPAWGQGYPPGIWPNIPYAAPQWYGAPLQPNQ